MAKVLTSYSPSRLMHWHLSENNKYAYHVQVAAGAFQPCDQIGARIHCICVEVAESVLVVDVVWSGLV